MDKEFVAWLAKLGFGDESAFTDEQIANLKATFKAQHSDTKPDAFTASLAVEIAPFGLRAHAVIPGQSGATAFADNARQRIEREGGFPAAYAELVEAVFRQHAELDPEQSTDPRDVAEAVWRAATDPDCPGQLPAGKDALAWAEGR